MKTIRIQLETLTCPSCIAKIEGVLNKQTGVVKAKVMFHSSKVKVTYNEEETNPKELSEIIEKLGYPVLS